MVYGDNHDLEGRVVSCYTVADVDRDLCELLERQSIFEGEGTDGIILLEKPATDTCITSLHETASGSPLG